jgi:hypothetical protein
MAFDLKGFQLRQAGGVCGTTGQYRYTEATYITLDAASAVEAAHYFDSIYQQLPVGTLIETVAAAGGTPVRKSYIVTASASTGVTIALQTTSAG